MLVSIFERNNVKKKLTKEENSLILKNREAERVAHHMESELKRLREKFYFGSPTHVYKVGDRVSRGGLESVIVTQVLDDGRIYMVHEVCTNQNYGKPFDYERDSYVSWTDICPYVTEEEDNAKPKFEVEDEVKLSVQSRQIESLLHSYWNWGIDTEADYQRGNVWTPDQEASLINSIFENVQIGTFVLVHREYESGKAGYEIIDGKQRLLTLVKFCESRFPFRGYLYRDLKISDRNHIDDYTVGYSEVRNITQAQKYKLFLRLNTCGKPQDQSHIEKVRKLLEESNG